MESKLAIVPSNLQLVNAFLVTCLDYSLLLNLLQIVKYQEQVDQLVFCTHHLVQNKGKAVMAQTTLIPELCSILVWLFVSGELCSLNHKTVEANSTGGMCNESCKV